LILWFAWTVLIYALQMNILNFILRTEKLTVSSILLLRRKWRWSISAF
jgi:hypothetical protein